MTDPAPHRARKRFGQNFLVDPNIIDKIVDAIEPAPGDNLVEIGPGQGALTKPLLERTPNLTAIELDRDLAADLQRRFAAQSEFTLLQGDALSFDFSQLATPERPLRIVGNLPYNISTPLLFHLLRFQGLIQDMHFMLQREVVERLTAEPRTKAYGRLGIVTQYHCRTDYLFSVPPGCFRPAPKVESAIVRLTPRPHKPVEAADPERFAKIVKLAFQQRRKTLRNALKPLAEPAVLDGLGIDLTARPETLTVAEFVQLSNKMGDSLK